MVFFSTERELKQLSKAEEAKGKLSTTTEEKLMHSILNAEKKTINDGKLIEEAINRGIGSFTPNLLFEQIVKNYSAAKQLFGEKLIQLITGYEPDYLEKNLGIPEFRKELKKTIAEKIDELKQKRILDSEGAIAEKGIELASLVLLTAELDRLVAKGILGEKTSKKTSHYGERTETRHYKKGDSYKNLAIRKTIRNAIRRTHRKIMDEDLETSIREAKGKISIVYCLDASASMRGEKIETCKKAGIALAYKAISEKNKAGLVVFGSEVKDFVPPTNEFSHLLDRITRITASRQTNISATIKKATELLAREQGAKHIIILTDALPTTGELPEKQTLEAVSEAAATNITVSLVGILLDAKGLALAKKIAMLGNGRLYSAKNLEELDRIVLEDYKELVESH